MSKQENNESLEHYRAAFTRGGDDRASSWLGSIQDTAFQQFAELGFPSRKLEEWRYTNVAPIAKATFELNSSDTATDVVREIEALDLPDFGGPRFVFVDGRFQANVSRMSESHALKFTSLAASANTEASERDGALATYATLLDSKDDGFTALNTAFANDGAVLTLCENTDLPSPAHLIFISSGDDRLGASFPRVLIQAEEGSRGLIIQEHVSVAGHTSLTTAVSEVVVEAGASLDMVLVQRESDASYHIARQAVRQHRDSQFSLCTLNLGGAILRNELEVVLADEGASCNLNGLYLGAEQQLVDNHTLVDHAVPNCESHELYKGILGDSARGVFRGRVVVRPDAQHTSATQQNRNLLLNRGAEVDTKPQLEIYADDVKCNHGSSIGQLDEEAMFFLRSRGLDENAAKSLLTMGFASQIAQSISNPTVREWAADAVQARLEHLFIHGTAHKKAPGATKREVE